jgi:hypothetical protein
MRLSCRRRRGSSWQGFFSICPKRTLSRRKKFRRPGTPRSPGAWKSFEPGPCQPCHFKRRKRELRHGSIRESRTSSGCGCRVCRPGRLLREQRGRIGSEILSRSDRLSGLDREESNGAEVAKELSASEFQSFPVLCRLRGRRRFALGSRYCECLSATRLLEKTDGTSVNG